MGHLFQLEAFISGLDYQYLLLQCGVSLSRMETTNNHLEGWHRKFNAVISRLHPNIYQLVDVIKGEQALTDLAAVQLDAGSQPPRRRRKYIAVDQRLKLLKEAYVGGEKTIDRSIVGVAYNLSSFV